MKKDLTAIISGANRGIGKAISLALASKGYKTLLFGRSQENLNPIVKEITTKYPQSPEPETYICDLMKVDEVQSCLDRIVKNYATIDILVNNAGIYQAGSIENQVDDFKNLLNVNLVAPFQLIKSIVPIMKKQASGYIFNVASRAGKIGFEGSGFYAASKFGLVGLNESLYRELAKSNVKVTTLCPGWVNTDMALADASAPIDGDDMIQPEDLAKSIEYLLSLSKNTMIKELVIECKGSIA